MAFALASSVCYYNANVLPPISVANFHFVFRHIVRHILVILSKRFLVGVNCWGKARYLMSKIQVVP